MWTATWSAQFVHLAWKEKHTGRETCSHCWYLKAELFCTSALGRIAVWCAVMCPVLSESYLGEWNMFRAYSNKAEVPGPGNICWMRNKNIARFCYRTLDEEEDRVWREIQKSGKGCCLSLRTSESWSILMVGHSMALSTLSGTLGFF